MNGEEKELERGADISLFSTGLEAPQEFVIRYHKQSKLSILEKQEHFINCCFVYIKKFDEIIVVGINEIQLTTPIERNAVKLSIEFMCGG